MSAPATDISSEPGIGLRKTRKYSTLYIKAALTVLVLALLVAQVNWRDLTDALLKLRGWGIVGAVLLWIPNLYLQYLRWKLIASRAGQQVEAADIWASFWLGHTLGFVTPGRVGAYGRGFFLRNVPLGTASALTILERTYSAIAVNGLGLISLGALPFLGWSADWVNWGNALSWVLISGGTLVLLVGVFPGTLAHQLQGRLSKSARLRRFSSSLDAISSMTIPNGLLYLFLAILTLAVSLFQFQMVLRSLGAKVPVLAGLLAIQLNFFLKGNIPLTIGNVGVGEWTALLCLRGLGVADSLAVAASLTLFVLNVAVPAAIGLVYVKRVAALRSRWAWRDA